MLDGTADIMYRVRPSVSTRATSDITGSTMVGSTYRSSRQYCLCARSVIPYARMKCMSGGLPATNTKTAASF